MQGKCLCVLLDSNQRGGPTGSCTNWKRTGASPDPHLFLYIPINSRSLDTCHLAAAIDAPWEGTSMCPSKSDSSHPGWPGPHLRLYQLKSEASVWILFQILPSYKHMLGYIGSENSFFLQEHRRWRLFLFLFLILYEYCANKTWFLRYFSVIALQTFRIT